MSCANLCGRASTRLAAPFLLGLFFSLACNKPAAPVTQEAPAPLQRAERSTPVDTTLNVLSKIFELKSNQAFPLELPPHSFHPHLHGVFESFAGQAHGPSDETANVDFLILNEDQYTEFQQNRPSDTLFAIESSHNQAVNFDLPAALDRPVKYYLVFRSTSEKGPKKIVHAEFKVEF